MTLVRLVLRTVLRPVLLLCALAWVPFAILAAVNLDLVGLMPSAIAFIPYAIVLSALTAIVAWLVKARILALIAIAGLAVLLVPRLGRFTTNGQPPAQGDRIVIATSNLRLGLAHVPALLRLMRTNNVDVLAVQEDTPQITTKLHAAGIRTLFPYAVLDDAPHADGVSLYSRYPLTLTPRGPGDHHSAGGTITFPGGYRYAIRSAHPPPPSREFTTWRNTTLALSRAIHHAPRPTILAGDFNATLDEHPLRHLTTTNHLRDAADQRGIAWKPTWTNGTWAHLTLDHILVPAHIAIEAVTIHDLPGSDHDVVIAKLRLPA